MKELIIIGASGHGKVCADIARLSGYESIRFLDDDKAATNCAGYAVIGTVPDYRNYRESADFFVAIGNSGVRQRITEEVSEGCGNIVTLVHPDAVIAEDVKIGRGSVVMAGTVVNSGTVIGAGCIVNTASSVDHDCVIGDYVHVAVGAHIAGTVEIGAGTWVGAGVTVSNNLRICGGCVIGAGAVVVKDIDKPGTYVGAPVERIK